MNKNKFAALALTALLGAACASVPQTARADGLDYSTLNNKTYSYQDLAEAKAHSLSDRQIAKIAKIARLSREKFRPVAQAVYRGETFPLICEHYGVPFNALRDVNKDSDDVAAFEAAYEATGSQGERTPLYIPRMKSSDM